MWESIKLDNQICYLAKQRGSAIALLHTTIGSDRYPHSAVILPAPQIIVPLVPKSSLR